ncbi:MAG: glycosyltransferase, partial [Vicingaceae bacterium]
AKRLKCYEHHIYKSFSCATVISPSDRDLIFHYANEDIIVLPNGIDHEFFKPKQVEKEFELLFTGNMSYPPNVQSARFLVEYIMPLIWRELPKCKLLISGANPSKAVKKLAGEGVVVRPYIKDIRDSYNSSQVFIAPMFIGSGMQNKLLEAMAMNLPCITSELANRALNARENEELLIGKSYADYADKAVELLKNRKLANEIAQKGHSFVRNQFDWSTSNEILLNIINGKIPRS